MARVPLYTGSSALRRGRSPLPGLSTALVIAGLLLAPACSKSKSDTPAAALPTGTTPSIQSVTPQSGLPGSTAVIQGAGFTGTVQVSFGGSQALTYNVVNDTQITAIVPPAAATGPITVLNGNVTATSRSTFTVIPLPKPPAVTSFTPESGAPATVVTLTGSGFTGATGVAFGGVAAASYQVVNDTTLTATVPDTAVKGLISVSGPSGPPATSNGDFTVITSALPAPAVTSLSVNTGATGDTMTITGTGFTGATAVLFGGHSTTTFQVAASGTQITVTVPTGAKTGSVVVETPQGDSPVTAAATFTVAGAPPPPPAAPSVTTLNPTQGVPGTEVTLTGTGLAGVTKVTYGGMDLLATQFNVDSDTSIRIRVPDEAQASSQIEVATATAPPAQSAAFELLPSRRAILPQPTVQVDGPHGLGPWLNYPDNARSKIYGLVEPVAPVFHAYNPDGNVRDAAGNVIGDGNREGHFATKYTLFLKLPHPFFEVLPLSIRNKVVAQGIVPANVDILVASQDYQFDGVSSNGGIYLFRPHYWTDPDAPVSGIFWVPRNLTGGIFEADAAITFSGHPAGDFFGFSILTHGPTETTAGDVLVSGDTEPMAGFDVNTSTGLWSLTQSGERAAATLHLLFNDADQEALEGLLPTAGASGTVSDLIMGIAGSPLAATRGVQMFLALGRPVINVVTPGAVTGVAGAPIPQATLTGTGMDAATAVLLNGVAVTPFEVISDAIVKVTLPAGAAGALQVVSPLGTSDPAPIPAI